MKAWMYDACGWSQKGHGQLGARGGENYEDGHMQGTFGTFTRNFVKIVNFEDKLWKESLLFFRFVSVIVLSPLSPHLDSFRSHRV